MAVMMLLAAVPAASYVGLDLGLSASAASKVIKSGNCGENGSNVTFKLYDNGLLEISGKGAMKMYDGKAPYGIYTAVKDEYGDNYYVENKVKKLVIKNGVTSISTGAFGNFKKLTTVEMADTVTEIQMSAFAYCTSLSALSLSKGLQSIGGYAFSYCPSLAKVTIPDRVISIAEYAFWNCTVLKEVYIANSVKSIGYEAFSGCKNLSNIKMSDNVEEISGEAFVGTKYYNTAANWKNGVLYIGKALITANPKVVSGTCKIISGTKAIADNAFDSCTKLTGVVIPDAAASIGNYAFADCSKLSKITIPDSVKRIGTKILFSTAYSNNKTNWKNGLLYVGKKLVDANNTVTKAEIVAGTNTLSEGCFESTDITSVVLPDSITEIPDMAFAECYKLKSVKLPSKLKKIGLFAFSNCDSLKQITLPSSLTEIDDFAFYYTGIKKLTIPASVRIIGAQILGTTILNNNKNYTIKGYKNTVAEKYAVKNGYHFVSLGTHNHTFKVTKLTKATLTKDGQITKVCTGCNISVKTTIYKVSSIKLSATAYTYDGKVKTPSVIVKDSAGKTLKNGTDYTVKYSSGRKLPGTYKVAVAFKGNYSGSKTLSFSVSIGKVTGFKQVKQSGYKLSLQWNKVTGATGYEVFMYNTKSKKWVHVGTTQSTKMNFKSTTGTNQWRIRAKAVISNKTYYGPFSGTLTTKS